MKPVMKPDPETTCHHTGHKKTCRSFYINCPKWIKVTGKNPQTGVDVDEWGCADAWMPILLIENSQAQRQTGAAVESFRNEMVKGNVALGREVLKQIG
jgi:hypothetical protein